MSHQTSTVSNIFKIPIELEKELLPEADISIHSLLQYNLPPFDNTRLLQEPEARFFSCSDPEFIDDEAISQLHYLPIPSPKQICRLQQLCLDAVEAGFQSVTYRHLKPDITKVNEKRYLFWVITFWKEVATVKDVVKRWIQCRDWLTMQVQQKKSAERQILAQKANILLTLLPWGLKKPRGLADNQPIHSLWRYLGTSYLSCSEIEDALALIRTDMISSSDPEATVSTQLEGTPFIHFLLNAYRGHEEYKTSQELAWLRMAGKSLVTSDKGRLATITSLEPINGQQHWVALVISEGGRRVQYGDSLMQEIPSLLQDVIRWWVQHHRPTIDLIFEGLPIIPQSDGYSCGILAVSALQSAFGLPERTPKNDPASLRLDLFDRVLNEILKRMSDVDEGGVEGRIEVVEAANEAANVRGNMRGMEANVEREIEREIDAMNVKGGMEVAEAMEVKEAVVRESAMKEAVVRESAVKRTLADYWSVETTEERRARQCREAEKLSERSAELAEKRHQDECLKQAERAKYLREAQQRCRKRKLEVKLAAGWVPKRRKIDVINVVSSPNDNPPPTSLATTFAHTTVAEISRPHRQFKAEHQKTKKLTGRKLTHEPREAERTNWFMPLIWTNIEQAAARAGKPWSPWLIMKEAQRINPTLFEGLREQVIGRWIDKEGQARGVSRWSEHVLRLVKRNSPGGTISRVGILAHYPAIEEHIAQQLTSLRDAGVALTMVTIRALMIANIQEMAPELFDVQAKDGSQFKCSESFVRKFLHKTLGWSERRATKAAQKVPANSDQILRDAFLREAFIICDYSVPAALWVNTDQTQLVYQQGSDKTWNARGVKQVATIGQEEKRAFTLVPSISASGELLPMQAIYTGKTIVSCPSPCALGFERARELSFQMLPSLTTTYWSTQETMQTLVDTIIAPYFERKKRELGLPTTQHSIWKIDCWSVHRSQSFREWMKVNHSNIIIIYVPGGCTSVWQPLDVGIQCVLKLSMRRSAHRDIVKEVTGQFKTGLERVSIDTSLGTLRNRSLQWVLNAIDDIGDRNLILKAFELCQVNSDWNLSQASLTSPSTLEALRKLPHTNKQLYDEFCGISLSTSAPDLQQAEETPFTECPDDHSDIPIPVLISTLTGQSHEGFSVSADGALERNSQAESETVDNFLEIPQGRPKRVRQSRILFGGQDMWYEH